MKNLLPLSRTERRVIGFVLAAAFVLGGCNDRPKRESEAGRACIAKGRPAYECYAMCSASFASQNGSYVRECAHGVSAALGD